MAPGPAPSVASRVEALWALLGRPWLTPICLGLLIFALAVMPDSGNRFEGLAKFLQAAVWPAVVIAAFIIFRTSLEDLLIRATKFEGAGISAEFSPAITEQLQKSVEDSKTKAAQAATHPTLQQTQSATEIGRLVSEKDLPVVKQRLEELAANYSSARGLKSYDDARTQELAAVVAQMRALGKAAYFLRRDFAFDRDSGKRLATLAMLQILPDLDMLEWIAGRISFFETPFVQYQALQALLAAAHLGDSGYAVQIRAAYLRTVRNYNELDSDHRTERGDLLQEIEKEVRWTNAVLTKIEHS